MTLKQSVTKQGVQPQIFFACGVAEMLYRLAGLELTVTSLTDSHADRPASLHNRGLAVDLRTRNADSATVQKIMSELKLVLNPLGFDVVLESDHIHVEFDPKPGETWHGIETAPRTIA